MLEKIEAWYKGLPKWVRFIVQYPLAPLWGIPLFLAGLVLYVLLAPIILGFEAWEKFK